MQTIRVPRLLPRLIPFRYYSSKPCDGGKSKSSDKDERKKEKCSEELETESCSPPQKRQSSEVPAKDMAILEKEYEKLYNSDSRSLLKHHLTRDIFERLKHRTTPTYKSNLLDCIRSGLFQLNSSIGIYAPDPEAYDTFSELFNPIIESYHKGFKKELKHPPSCYGYGADFPDLDPERRFVISTRVRCGRSIKDYPFNPCLTQCDYAQLQSKVSRALANLCGEHAGKYYPLCNMNDFIKQKLVTQHLLFKENDRYLQSARATKYWPLGRGMFVNREKTFVVWVNEEDHVRIISMERGGDLGRVYERLIIGIESLAYQLPFVRDDRLGFLTFCPSNLGTSIRASVLIRLPLVGRSRGALAEVAEQFNLQVRGTHGEHTPTLDGIFDISNRRRMGLTEYEAVTEMYNGIKAIIELECQFKAEEIKTDKAVGKISKSVANQDKAAKKPKNVQQKTVEKNVKKESVAQKFVTKAAEVKTPEKRKCKDHDCDNE